jgi:hypothetical protein
MPCARSCRRCARQAVEAYARRPDPKTVIRSDQAPKKIIWTRRLDTIVLQLYLIVHMFCVENTKFLAPAPERVFGFWGPNHEEGRRPWRSAPCRCSRPLERAAVPRPAASAALPACMMGGGRGVTIWIQSESTNVVRGPVVLQPPGPIYSNA